jgi:integral membrane protein (TIGR01906 family)
MSGEDQQAPRERLDTAPALDKRDQAAENTGVAVAGRQRETHMGFARTLATIAFIIALPVALITTNVRLLANAPLVYRYAFDRYDAESSTGLSRTDLNSTAAALRTYFNDGEKTFYHTVTEDGLQTSVFNARETRHMQDVKRLFVLQDDAQEVAVVYVLVYVVAMFIWAREGSMRQLAAQSLMGIALGTAFVAGVAIFAAFGFEAAFTRFHTIAFSNDFWELNPATDHLIQMFPEPFWRDMTVLLGLMCAAEGLLIGGVSAVYLLSTRGERRRLAASMTIDHSQTQAA